MHCTTIILALTAALATAMLSPDAHKTFIINMKTGSGNHPLALIKNGTKGQFVLEAAETGTPAYLTGKGTYQSLFMALPSGTYGLFAPEVGDDYGYAGAVYGVKGKHQKQWGEYHKDISHKLQAALNQLYACKDHANGKEGLFLKFGTPSQPHLDPPKGCDVTELKAVSS